MKFRLFAVALAAGTILAAQPAAAQLAGVAVTEPSIAIAASQGLQTGYAQINTTFQAQRTQIDQVQQQRAGLLRQFDTNGDGQLDETEQAAAQANTTVVQQIQGLETQINQLQQPITQARVYVVEQLLRQYAPALQQVVAQNNLKIVLNPSQVVFVADGVDITEQVKTALDRLVPTVTTAVPAGWQPNRQSVQVYQQVSEVLLAAAVQAQQAQAQGAQPGAAPAPAPTQPVQGR